MYENLIGAIAAKRITMTRMAAEMGIERTTLYKKLYGGSDFTVSEKYFICRKFFPDMNEEELFKFTEKPA